MPQRQQLRLNNIAGRSRGRCHLHQPMALLNDDSVGNLNAYTSVHNYLDRMVAVGVAELGARVVVCNPSTWYPVANGIVAAFSPN